MVRRDLCKVLQGEIITLYSKYIGVFKNIIFSKSNWLMSTNFGIKNLWVKATIFFKERATRFIPVGDSSKTVKILLNFKNILLEDP